MDDQGFKNADGFFKIQWNGENWGFWFLPTVCLGVNSITGYISEITRIAVLAVWLLSMRHVQHLKTELVAAEPIFQTADVDEASCKVSCTTPRHQDFRHVRFVKTKRKYVAKDSSKAAMSVGSPRACQAI